MRSIGLVLLSLGLCRAAIPEREVRNLLEPQAVVFNAYSSFCNLDTEALSDLCFERPLVVCTGIDGDLEAWVRSAESLRLEPSERREDREGRWLDSLGLEAPFRYGELVGPIFGRHFLGRCLYDSAGVRVDAFGVGGPERPLWVETLALPPGIRPGRLGDPSQRGGAWVVDPEGDRLFLAATTGGAEMSYTNKVMSYGAEPADVIVGIPLDGEVAHVVGEPGKAIPGGTRHVDALFHDGQSLFACDSELGRITAFDAGEEQVRTWRNGQANGLWSFAAWRDRTWLVDGRVDGFSAIARRVVEGRLSDGVFQAQQRWLDVSALRPVFAVLGDRFFETIAEGDESLRLTGEILESHGIWMDVVFALADSTLLAASAAGDSLHFLSLADGARWGVPLDLLMTEIRGDELLDLEELHRVHPTRRMTRLSWLGADGDDILLHFSLSRANHQFGDAEELICRVDPATGTVLAFCTLRLARPVGLDGAGRLLLLSRSNPLQLLRLWI